MSLMDVLYLENYITQYYNTVEQIYKNNSDN